MWLYLTRFNLETPKRVIGPNKKICVFRVTLPYPIILVEPSNFFHIFLKKKKKKIGVTKINYLC